MRTIFVETTSSPSNLPASVSIGFSNKAKFEATTPDARNVRADGICSTIFSRTECRHFGSAELTGNRTGKTITLCLTDLGKRRCETSSDGTVFLGATFSD